MTNAHKAKPSVCQQPFCNSVNILSIHLGSITEHVPFSLLSQTKPN